MESRPDEHLETELKFDADPDVVVPDLSGLAPGLTVTEPVTTLLEARYFDTADGRLAAAPVTLRRRTGGADEGWHLKLPVSPTTRRELHEPLGNAEDVPERFQEAVRTWTQGEPLHVIALLQTRRTTRNLVTAAGEVTAELADDLVTGRLPGSAGSAAQAVTWREIEIELVSGDPGILTAVASALVAAGATRSASASKLARLLGSAAARTAEKLIGMPARRRLWHTRARAAPFPAG